MKRELNKSVVILMILIIYPSLLISQVKEDTISIGGNRIVFSYPLKSIVSITNYEEGFFKDINCIEDMAIIGLHYGAMVTIPLVNHQKKTVTNECFIPKRIRQTRGFYYKNEEKKYFREDNIFKYGFSVYYTNVPENKVYFYESLLNSIKYIEGDIKNVQ